MDIEIVKSFGPYSYLSQHILAFHDPDVKEVVDGMKIGVDQSSVDQKKMTEIACVGKNVRFVNVEYTQILQKSCPANRRRGMEHGRDPGKAV